MNRKIRFGVYGLVALFILLTYFIQESKQQNTLPIIGKVPHFDLIDSQNRNISKSDLIEKVWVADFIFTTCDMACPVMTGNMNLIHQEFRANDAVRVVSISVYPEYDTPEVLTQYASQYGANINRWHFLTGPEESIKNIIKDGFKIGDYEDIIFHSEKFALVDKKGNIRGYYNGMDTEEMDKLKKDVKSLLSESI
tara:strand:- start:628 stop:1212 length:585 start_codon:yes stop_codon:yes gene_type:complete